MRKLYVTLTIGIVVFAFMLSTGLPTGHAAEAKKVKMGTIQALTGPAAPWGVANTNIINFRAAEINSKGGFKVKGETYEWETVNYDGKYVPAEAVKAVNKAIYSDKVTFLAFQGAPSVIACETLLKENNILTMNVANIVPGASIQMPNFYYCPCIEGIYSGLLPFMNQKVGIKTMACINPDDETGRSTAKRIKQFSDTNKISVVAEEYFQRGTKEFSPLLTRVISKNPDLIDTGVTDPASAALICKQAKEMGYKGEIVLTYGVDPDVVVKIAGPYLEGTYLTLAGPIRPEKAADKDFYDRYMAKYHEWSTMVWILAELMPSVTKAIVETQSFDTATLTKHLESMTWDSTMGTLRWGGAKLFGAKRQVMLPTALYRAEKGEMVLKTLLTIPEGIFD
jgi:branched-chain amino acid transport system substrate-binding protein